MIMQKTTHSPTLQISSVKRIHGKAMLVLSNGTSICMPRAMLRERPYRSGMAFDQASFDTFLFERSYPFALEKAVSLLASRSRTAREIEEYLRRNAYPEKVISRVMARLIEAGYLNDSDYAANWAVSRSRKGLGERRIRMELRQKGVPQQEIDAALSTLEEEDVLSSAVMAAEKAARGKNLALQSDRQRIVASLVRRGYDYSIAKRALHRIIDQFE